MKKTKLVLLLALSSLLTGCSFLESFINKTGSETNNQQQNEETNHEDGGNTQTDDDGGNTHSDDGGNTQSDDGGGTSDYHPTNKALSLEDYTSFEFHGGHEPEYNDAWNFYYGDSHNPNGCLWENPNESVDYSGIEFKENCFIVSPKFNSWNKLEIRLNFWFTLHTSNKYSAVNGQPQFKLEMYNSSDKLISVTDILIEKSDVPTNNTTREIRTYIFEPTATFFILRWNNYVPNKQGGYGQILCDATLKGWPYDR